MKKLSELFDIPGTRDLDIDDPSTTQLRRSIIEEKKFLKEIYLEWYQTIATAFSESKKPVLEIGSGAGFLETKIPGLITSDVLPISGLQIIADAFNIPFANNTLSGITMINVLHHFSSPRKFFREALRTVESSGRLVMIEPWATSFSRQIYTHLHHEEFDPNSEGWSFAGDRPLSDANGAMPWIIFSRDRDVFEKAFPEWQIIKVNPMMPFRYLISGGFTKKSLLPDSMYKTIMHAEGLLQPWFRHLAMFAEIVLEKR